MHAEHRYVRVHMSYIHAQTRMYIRMPYIYTHANTHIHTFMYAYTHEYMLAYLDTALVNKVIEANCIEERIYYSCTCIHTYKYSHMHTQMHPFIYIYIKTICTHVQLAHICVSKCPVAETRTRRHAQFLLEPSCTSACACTLMNEIVACGSIWDGRICMVK
jgi:hypothetical protein